MTRGRRVLALGAGRTLAALWRAHRDGLALAPAEAVSYDTLSLSLGGRRLVCPTDPEDVAQVLTGAGYRKSAWMRRRFAPVLGSGLLTSDGDAWREHRRLIAPFFRPERLVAASPWIDAMLGEMLDGWAARCAAGPVAIVGDLRRLARDVAVRFLFSPDIADETRALADRVIGVLDEAGRLRHSLTMMLPDGWPRFESRRLRRTMAEARRGCTALVRRRRGEEPIADDLVSVLAHPGGALSEPAIVDEMLTLLVAGYETTAQGMAWSILSLAEHPAVVASVRAAAPRSDAASAIGRTILWESLRLYPPVYAIGREATTDATLGGVACPRGTVVNISPHAIHRAPRLWEEPAAFRPGRFDAARPPERTYRGAYLPFGLGPRMCIGRGLAELEMLSVIDAFCRRFDAAVVPPRPRALGQVTLQPATPIRLLLRPSQE